MTTSYQFSQLINFTNTTTASFVGSNGLIQMTQPSRNLLTFTQEFDNAVWTKSNVNAYPFDPVTATTLGPELVTNGDFSQGNTGWTTGLGWSISGGSASIDGTNATASTLSQTTIATGIGRAYLVSYTYSVTAGSIRLNTAQFGTTTSFAAGTSGVYTAYLVAIGNTGSFSVQAQVANTIATVDNISVREVIGGLVTAPDGTPTADTVITTTNTGSQIYQTISTIGSGDYTYSMYAKQGSGPTDSNSFGVRNNTTSTNAALLTINYSTGVITQTVGSGATAINVGNGWWRIIIPFTLTATVGNAIRFYAGTSGGVESVEEYCFVWGAQLETGSTVTAYTRNVGGRFPPRFEYDPITLAPKGILIEEQRTNLLTYTRAVGGTNWTSTHAPTLDAAVAPDGTMTMTQANPASTSSQIYQTVTLAVNTAYRLSIYAQAGTSTRSRLSLFDTTGAAFEGELSITWASGVPTQSAVGGTAANATFEDVGGGIYRISVTVTTDAVNTNYRFQWYSDIVSGTGTTFIWGAQLEAGAFVTSYIPTVASTVTRAADQTTIIAPMYDLWYNPSEGTFVVEGDVQFAGATRYLVTDTVTQRFAYGTSVGVIGTFDGTNAAVTASGTGVSGVTFKLATSYSSTDGLAATANGGAVSTSTSYSGSFSSATAIGLWNLSAGNSPATGHIRSITYYPYRVSNARLQQLSTL